MHRAMTRVGALVLCMVILGGSVFAEPQDMKVLVEALGVGADVVIALQYGSEVRGRITDIRPDMFEAQVEGSSRHFRYDQIRALRLPSMRYSTSGTTDVVAVRRIVTMMGTGRRVKGNTREKQEFDGTIETVGSDSFAVRGKLDLRHVAYQDVVALRNPIRKAPIIAVSVVAAVAVPLFIFMSMYCANEGC
jgi:hypothetical protein